MDDSYVLDSFSLLAYLQDEPGRRRVVELLEEAERSRTRLLLCIVNYGEVLYNIERRRDVDEADETILIIDNLPLEVVEADRWLTFAASHVKARHPISYADAFAVALAQREGATVVTGDPEFSVVEELVKVEWLPGTGPRPI